MLRPLLSSKNNDQVCVFSANKFLLLTKLLGRLLVGASLFLVDDIGTLCAVINWATSGELSLRVVLVLQKLAVRGFLGVDKRSAIGHLLAEEGLVGFRVSQSNAPGLATERLQRPGFVRVGKVSRSPGVASTRKI